MITEGEATADFTLPGTQGDEIRDFTLSEFANGRPTVLVFYIYDYSPVCTDQMCEINDMEFLTFNDDVAVLGISTDGPYSHRQFINDNDITYPLLTDGNKNIYEQFGLLEEDEDGNKMPRRGMVLVDEDLTVQYRWVSDSNWDEWEMGPMQEVHKIVQKGL